MAWHARYGEGDASGVPSRYATTARAGSAIGASAYFMREDERRGSAHARPDPTGHVIAKQARRAFEASRGEDAVGESVRYVRSLRYLPRERGEDGAVLEARVSSFASKKAKEPESPNATSSGTPHVRTFGYPTGDNGLGAFEFPATRSVMWDPSAVAETTHISAAAHAASVSLTASAAAALAARCAAAAEASPTEGTSSAVSAAATFVASRRAVDRRGAFRVSAALEITAVGDAGPNRATESRADATDVDGDDEAWSSPADVTVAIAAAPEQTRESIEAMTSFDANDVFEDGEDENDENDGARRASVFSVATRWRARLAATTRAAAVADGVELLVSARVRVPASAFAATPIAPPRVADAPLHRALVAAQTRTDARATEERARTGFLTMDRTRRLMLLDETDPRALDVPAVGVWVSGVTNPTHLAVWAACHRFWSTEALKDKATQRGAFLCLVYPPATAGKREDARGEEKPAKKTRATPPPPPTCYDVRLVEPRGASPRKHVDLAATFACVPGEAAEARLAPPAAIRVERNADAAGLGRGDEASADAGRVTLRRRGDSSADAAASASREETAFRAPDVSPATPGPSRDGAFEARRGDPKRASLSPDWAPFYGAAPRTSYEAAAAAAAARAAAANAKLAASRGATPSSLLSPATRSPVKPERTDANLASGTRGPESSSLPLEGAARVVVEEQQRVIAELRAAVAFLETEMAELTRPISAREREAQARDLLGGLEGATDFARGDGERDAEIFGDAEAATRTRATESRATRDGENDDAPALGGASPVSGKSTLRKALAFARGGEAPEADGEASALYASFRSDEVDAMYGMDTPFPGSVASPGDGDDAASDAKAARKAAREAKKAEKKAEKKAKRKSRRGRLLDEDAAGAAARLAEDSRDAASREERLEEDEVLGEEKVDAESAAAAAAAAEARALGTQNAAHACFAETRADFPAAPQGLPPDEPEPPPGRPAQPNRRFSESPYVESVEETDEKGERVADPLPGGGARYPAEPLLAHAATGYAFADDLDASDAEAEAEASDTDALLDASSLMVDPESMDGETAARAAAATRRDALFRLSGESFGSGSSRADRAAKVDSHEREPRSCESTPVEGAADAEETSSNPRRAFVRAGLDPMYPVIDCSFEDEGADDEDERVEELLGKYGGGGDDVASSPERDDETTV